MRIAFCVTKDTDTHNEYVILIAFPLQQWLSYTSIPHLVITFMSFSTLSIRSWNSYAIIRGLPLWRVKTIMFYSRTPSLPSVLYALLIVILTSTDPGHSHMPNSTVLQYTNCAAMHTRLQHGADLENEFCLTINLNLNFCCYNSNKYRHTILSKSQHYKTPAATHFRPHWSIIR